MIRLRITRTGCATTAMVAILATLVPIAVADDPTTCTLEGIVVDDEVQVVEGAQVGLRDTSWITMSGPDGRFEFAGIDPGLYTVEASKAGYFNNFASADCVAGETNDGIVLQLVPAPPPPTPYSTTFAMTGHISCAIGTFSSSSDVCANAGLGPPGANEFSMPIDPEPITGAVYELDWAPTSPHGLCLSLTFPGPQAANGVTYSTDDRFVEAAHAILGESPLGVTVESSGAENPLHLGNVGSELAAFVRPAWTSQATLADDVSSGCSPSLVVQQSFTFYATLFYNGAPVPDGYTHLD